MKGFTSVLACLVLSANAVSAFGMTFAPKTKLANGVKNSIPRGGHISSPLVQPVGVDGKSLVVSRYRSFSFIIIFLAQYIKYIKSDTSLALGVFNLNVEFKKR